MFNLVTANLDMLSNNLLILASTIGGQQFKNATGGNLSMLITVVGVLLAGVFVVRMLKHSITALIVLVVVIVAVGYFVFGEDLMKMLHQ